MRKEFRAKLQRANILQPQPDNTANSEREMTERHSRGGLPSRQQLKLSSTTTTADADGNEGEDNIIMDKTMSREVRAEVFGGVQPSSPLLGPGGDELDSDDEKENIPQHKLSRPKTDIFLKVGSPTHAEMPFSADDENGVGDRPPPSPSFRHTILQRVISPAKGVDDGAPLKTGRSWKELRLVWRRAVFRQMLLNRLLSTPLQWQCIRPSNVYDCAVYLVDSKYFSHILLI